MTEVNTLLFVLAGVFLGWAIGAVIGTAIGLVVWEWLLNRWFK